MLVLLLPATVAAGSPLLVTVTDVGDTTAILWARASRAGEVVVEVTAAGAPPRRLTRATTAAADLLVRVALEGLAPATRYRYVASQGSERVTGEFGTAPPPGEAARVSFLWGGDLGGAGLCRLVDGGYRIFTAMSRLAADFFVFAGDTIYADVACKTEGYVPGGTFRARTLPEYRARHRYNREDGPFQEFLRRTPVYATWDDHEVRNDFAGPTEPLMPVGRQAFLEYWPVATDADDPHRIYRSVRWGRLLEMFILDTRQYRSDNREQDGPGKTMLGGAQRQWLLDGVTTSTATWKVVVSSVPLGIPSGRPERRDSWTDVNVLGLAPENGTGFVTERDAILRHFRTRGVKNLVFLAADVHHAELIRHHPTTDWSFHEFVAGPLSASTGRPRPLDIRLGSRTLFAQGGLYNFGEVAIEPAHLTVRVRDQEGAVLFSHAIGPE
jgi:alkaline phosphatase D